MLKKTNWIYELNIYNNASFLYVVRNIDTFDIMCSSTLYPIIHCVQPDFHFSCDKLRVK